MIRVYPDIYSIRLGNGLRIDDDQRLEAFGDDLDFGAFNDLDFGTFAFPMNDLNGGALLTPSSEGSDQGAF